MRTVRPAKKSKSIKLPIELYKQVRAIALREGKVIIYIVSEAVKEYLEKRKPNYG